MDYFLPATPMGKIIVALIGIFFSISLTIIIKFILHLLHEKKQLDNLDLNTNLVNSNETIEKKHFAISTNLDKSWVKDRIDNIYETVRINGKIIFEDLTLLQENQFVRSGFWIGFFMSSLVILGLLGTFMGLIDSVSLLDISAAAGDKAAFSERAGKILAGMKMAFSTTIDGIIGTLILGGINTVRKNMYVSYVDKLDTITVTKVMPLFAPGDSATELNSAAESLKAVVIQISDDAKILTKVSENIELNQTNLTHFVENFKEGTEKITDYQKTVQELLEKIENMHIQLKSSVDQSSELHKYYSTIFESQNTRVVEVAKYLHQNEIIMKNLNQEIIALNQAHLNNIDKIVNNQNQQLDLLNSFTLENQNHQKSVLNKFAETMDTTSENIDNSIKVLKKFIEGQQVVLDKIKEGSRRPERIVHPAVQYPNTSKEGNGADSFFTQTESKMSQTTGRKTFGQIIMNVFPWMKGR